MCDVDGAVARVGQIAGGTAEWPSVRERVDVATAQALLAFEGHSRAGGSRRGVSLVLRPREVLYGERSVAGMERSAWLVVAACDERVVGKARRGDVLGGRRAARGGLWTVEEVVDVRYPAVRRGRQLDVRVLWAGQWGSVQVQWIPVSRLNSEARRVARAMERRRLEKRTVETCDGGGDSLERRVSPRLAGELALEGRTNPEPRRERRRPQRGGARSLEEAGAAGGKRTLQGGEPRQGKRRVVSEAASGGGAGGWRRSARRAVVVEDAREASGGSRSVRQRGVGASCGEEG